MGGHDKTTLIIPDIHNDYETAEKIIEMTKPNMTVFLGDYFDDFFDNEDIALDVAHWLKKSLRRKNRVHLFGNHDIIYLTESKAFICSGYTSAKHAAIKSVEINTQKMRMWHWVNGWLCTHAGVSRMFFDQIRGTETDMETVLSMWWEKIIDSKWNDDKNPFLQVGFSRSGNAECGGLLWCDYNKEFVDIPNVKQIFGHTPETNVRHQKDENTEHYCIDTRLYHYVIVKNGEVFIHNTNDLQIIDLFLQE